MTSIQDANRAYFDKMAHEYDEKPWIKELSLRVMQSLVEKRQWIGLDSGEAAPSSIRFLDYACGTGSITRALAPYVGEIRGIDLSSKSVERYNSLAADLPAGTRAVVGDLLGDTPAPAADAEFSNFDLIAVGFAFHHFSDYQLGVERLQERLKPGGTLLIVEFLGEVDAAHVARMAHHHGVEVSGLKATMHRTGFEKGEIAEMMRKAGMVGAEEWELPGDFVVKMQGMEMVRKAMFVKGKRTT